jgi:hypothetical protein
MGKCTRRVTCISDGVDGSVPSGIEHDPIGAAGDVPPVAKWRDGLINKLGYQKAFRLWGSQDKSRRTARSKRHVQPWPVGALNRD